MNKEFIINLATSIIGGLTVVAGWFLIMGRKFQILDDLKTNFEKLGNKFDKLGDRIGSIQITLTKHDCDIKNIKTNTVGVTHSPTVPSEEGKKLLEESGFNKIYPKIKPRIFQTMDEQNLRTLYDYQEWGENALHLLILENDPIVDPLKDYVVNHPNYSLNLIFRVASWMIRDDYNQYKSSKEQSNN